MPKVSVIIPVYNTEKYLRRCLDSVCNQTLSDIEMICINDCSTDNSLNILREYSEKDNRIKIIDFKENKGVSIARNTGIDEAQGEYIGFIDSDDFVDLDFYEQLYNKAIETGSDAVKGNIYNCDENGANPTLTSFYNQNHKIKRNKSYFYYGFTSAIYKRELITKHNIKFPENITHFEDPYFSIKLSVLANSCKIVNNAKYYYIKHSNSACSNACTITKTKDFIKCVLLIINELNQYELSQNDYSIYLNFLLEQVIPYCSSQSASQEANLIAVEGLLSMFENIKYPKKEILGFYFLTKKENLKKESFKFLRNRIESSKL